MGFKMSTRPLTKTYVEVLGHRMAYHERGRGEPILFLHGNPTSSYIWRNVLPILEGLGRLIAPDLLGMGASAKLPDPNSESYRFTVHRDHLAAFIDDVVGTKEKILLVVHDWGSALGFDWARTHSDRVRGIAYMEAIVRPIAPADGRSEVAATLMQLRSDQGEQLILDQNMFVEQLLPALIIRKLSEEEMDEYRRPFQIREDRWPTLTWPREIPIGGDPVDVVAIVQDYARFMSENDLPKLFVNAEPGAILVGSRRDFCREWKNQSQVTVAGRHYIQEDSPRAIGEAIASWIAKYRL
jgi:haloalkane dehalogenase